MSKPHVLQLLEELITDATFWFEVQLLPDSLRESEFEQLSPTEKYWYKYLFPTWINETDPKIYIWKQKRYKFICVHLLQAAVNYFFLYLP